ncbi:hypothetical protein LTR66_009702 [Elasticomyces elasticus]|nr:hypothetical protein LTR66_009702 [Elasticomyces elasticus]
MDEGTQCAPDLPTVTHSATDHSWQPGMKITFQHKGIVFALPSTRRGYATHVAPPKAGRPWAATAIRGTVLPKTPIQAPVAYKPSKIVRSAQRVTPIEEDLDVIRARRARERAELERAAQAVQQRAAQERAAQQLKKAVQVEDQTSLQPSAAPKPTTHIRRQPKKANTQPAATAPRVTKNTASAVYTPNATVKEHVASQTEEAGVEFVAAELEATVQIAQIKPLQRKNQTPSRELEILTRENTAQRQEYGRLKREHPKSQTTQPFDVPSLELHAPVAPAIHLSGGVASNSDFETYWASNQRRIEAAKEREAERQRALARTSYVDYVEVFTALNPKHGAICRAFDDLIQVRERQAKYWISAVQQLEAFDRNSLDIPDSEHASQHAKQLHERRLVDFTRCKESALHSRNQATRLYRSYHDKYKTYRSAAHHSRTLTRMLRYNLQPDPDFPTKADAWRFSIYKLLFEMKILAPLVGHINSCKDLDLDLSNRSKNVTLPNTSNEFQHITALLARHLSEARDVRDFAEQLRTWQYLEWIKDSSSVEQSRWYTLREVDATILDLERRLGVLRASAERTERAERYEDRSHPVTFKMKEALGDSRAIRAALEDLLETSYERAVYEASTNNFRVPIATCVAALDADIAIAHAKLLRTMRKLYKNGTSFLSVDFDPLDRSQSPKLALAVKRFVEERSLDLDDISRKMDEITRVDAAAKKGALNMHDLRKLSDESGAKLVRRQSLSLDSASSETKRAASRIHSKVEIPASLVSVGEQSEQLYVPLLRASKGASIPLDSKLPTEHMGQRRRMRRARAKRKDGVSDTSSGGVTSTDVVKEPPLPKEAGATSSRQSDSNEGPVVRAVEHSGQRHGPYHPQTQPVAGIATASDSRLNIKPTVPMQNVQTVSGCGLRGLPPAEHQPRSRWNIPQASHTEPKDSNETKTKRKSIAASAVPLPTLEALVADESLREMPEDQDSDSPAAAPIKEDTAIDHKVPEVHQPLDYQIPLPSLRNAIMASRNSGAAYWSYALYRSASNRKVQVHYCRNLALAERELERFVGQSVVGFDLEWKMGGSKESIKDNVSLIQLATEDHIGLFHLAVYKGENIDDLIGPTMRAILESSRTTKAGVNVAGDARRLRNFLGLEPRGLFELSHLYKLVKYSASEPHKVNRVLVALDKQVEDTLVLPMSKGPVRTSDWSTELRWEQIQYSASDAYAGLRLYDRLEEKRKKLDPTPPRPSHFELALPILLANGQAAKSLPKTRLQQKVLDETTAETTPAEAIQTVGEDESIESLADDPLDADDLEKFVDDASTNEDLVDEAASGEPEIADLPLASTPGKGSYATDEVKYPDLSDLSLSDTIPETPIPKISKAPEMLEAETWVAEWQSRLPSSHTIKATPANLKAYALWHVQTFSLEDVARLMRDPPLQSTTVASYVLQAVKLEDLSFDPERMREVLNVVPASVHHRYRGILDRLRV